MSVLSVLSLLPQQSKQFRRGPGPIVLALHGGVAGHYHGRKYEGALVCR